MTTISRETAQRVYKALSDGLSPIDRYGRRARVYYFINVGHPAVRMFERQFRAENGIGIQTPLSDTQRTQLELSLLNEDALAAVLALTEQREREAKK